MSARDAIRSLACGFPKSVRERRPLVVLEAVDGYADDSAETNAAYVLAGWISTAPRWEDFSEGFEKAGLPRTMHLKNTRRLRGERVRKLAELTNQYAMYRVDCLLHQGNYDLTIKGKIDPAIDSPYFVLFFQVIIAAATLLDRIGSDDTVDWIFDEQGKIGCESVGWYYWIKERAQPNLKRRLGATPIFRDDEKVLPLKAADLFAWQIRRHVAYEAPKNEPLSPILESFLGDKYGVSCNFTGEYLEAMARVLRKDQPIDQTGLMLKAQCQFHLPRKCLLTR